MSWAEWSPVIAFATAFVVTFFSIPAIIRLSLVKKLYDKPDERKVHGRRIGALGGICIFGGLIFSFILCTHKLYYPQFNSILAGLIVLFVTGVKDDLYPMVPSKKFLAQVIAVGIVTVQGNVRITSLYGMFDTYGMPYVLSLAVSMIFFLAIINSFNFIDGINGLAGGIGTIVCGVYAYWFWQMNETLFLILSLCVAGALLAFLRYNLVRARIFMGDSGSLVVGFLCALLTVYFIQKSEGYKPNIFFNIQAVVYAFSVLIIPIFDTVRVIALRLWKRKSPFHPDRNHIHHLLLDSGLNHLQTALLLFAVNGGYIAFTWFTQDSILPKYQLIIILASALALSQWAFAVKKRKTTALRS